MKTLELNQLEALVGGRRGSGGRAASCVGFALGIVSIGLLVAFPPAGLAIGMASGLVAGASTGISMAGCV